MTRIVSPYFRFHSDQRGFVLSVQRLLAREAELATEGDWPLPEAETGQAEPDWLSNRLLPNAASLLLLPDPRPHNPSPGSSALR